MLGFKQYNEKLDKIKQGNYSIGAKSFIKAFDELNVDSNDYRGLYDVEGDTFIIWDANNFIHTQGLYSIRQIKNVTATSVLHLDASVGSKQVYVAGIDEEEGDNLKEIIRTMKKFFRGFLIDIL